MDPLALSALFLAALVNAAIPGPVLLLVIARAGRRGAGAGLAVSLGATLAVAILLGVVWMVLLGAVQMAPQILATLKLAGIVLLVWLGLRMLHEAGVPHPGHAPRLHLGNVAAGLALGLSSPFNLIFLLALLPQAVAPAALTVERAVLASALVLLGTAIPKLLATMIVTLHTRRTPVPSAWLARAGGLALLGFAGFAAAMPV